jgi:hypothetical protein
MSVSIPLRVERTPFQCLSVSIPHTHNTIESGVQG